MDLVIHDGYAPLFGIEIKFSDAPRASRGFSQARRDLGNIPCVIVHPGDESWSADDHVEIMGIRSLIHLAGDPQFWADPSEALSSRTSLNNP